MQISPTQFVALRRIYRGSHIDQGRRGGWTGGFLKSSYQNLRVIARLQNGKKQILSSIIVQDITRVPMSMSVSNVFIMNFEGCPLIQHTSFKLRILLPYLKSRMSGERNGTNTKQVRLLEELEWAVGEPLVENLGIPGGSF